MKAFEVLDQENKGYLTTEELTKYMTEEGTQSYKMELLVGTSCFHLPVLFPKDIWFVCYAYVCYLTDNKSVDRILPLGVGKGGQNCALESYCHWEIIRLYITLFVPLWHYGCTWSNASFDLPPLNHTLLSSIGSNTQLVSGGEGFKSCQSKPVFFQMS